MIEITVKWETYNRFKKQWQPTLFKGKSPDTTWHFYSYSAAIDYICQYMEKKKAVPSNKKGVKYFIAENGYWKDGKFYQYGNSSWDNGYTFFSQWIITGNWLLRITFEQYKPVELKRDYHDPKPNPWSHNATITKTTPDGKKTSKTIRTIRGEDKKDTTEQRRKARKKELGTIRRQFDEYTRQEYGMSASEYENREDN